MELKRLKWTIGVVALLWMTTGKAQTTVTLTFQDASTQSIDVSEYGKIYFSDQYMYIDEGNSVPYSFAVSNIRSMVFSEVLGVQDIVTENFKIYPNPVHNQLYVSGNEFASLPYSLHATDGRLLRQGICENGSPIFVGDLPAGLYILRINNISLKINKL